MSNEARTLDNLMEEAIETSMDTTRPVLEDGEYELQVVKVNPPEQKTSQRTGKDYVEMVVMFKATNGPDDGLDYSIRHQVFLDIDENGRLATGKGKNINLGRLREALGCNSGRFVLGDLFGRTCKATVVKKLSQNNAEFNEIKRLYAN